MDNSIFAVDSNFAIWFAIFVVGHFVLLISAFITYDLILKLEYSSYRIYWESDGQPFGFFWIAPEKRKFFILPIAQIKNQFARDKLSRKWLFSTPEWMINDARALQLVSRYRWLILLWTIFYGVPILVFIITIILLDLRTI
ncbi:MAG: hypothetical protein L0287_10970 [Anaerolineae bacterium]|nr:hypothetical protein [Anaerolineae bacterium]MCI0611131.1 hypothetical protein [Anaerolineae bacterium]